MTLLIAKAVWPELAAKEGAPQKAKTRQALTSIKRRRFIVEHGLFFIGLLQRFSLKQGFFWMWGKTLRVNTLTIIKSFAKKCKAGASDLTDCVQL
jgi:hypothetical protein